MVNRRHNTHPKQPPHHGPRVDAIAHHERALRLRPGDPKVLNDLGNALTAQGRHDEAVARFEQAIALNPNAALPHYNLATVLETMDRTHEALAYYERAHRLDPGLVDAKLGIASVLRQFGRLDEARDIYEAVVRVAPRKIAAWFGLSALKRFVDGDPHLAALEAFARAPASLSEADRIHLHFALGKAYGDLDRHERSFTHLLEGNRLKRRQFTADEAKVLGFMDGCREVFTPAFLRTMAGHGDASHVPVFIVGMMRSGSTLVEQILASHPLVFGGGERPYFEQSLTAAQRTAGTAEGAWIGMLATRYLRTLTATAPEASRITDKLLGNFNHIGLIHLALPNAKIVHVSRDPLDTCLSCFSNLFTGQGYFLYDLGELGRYYRHYEQLMAHWRAVLPDGVMLDVRYEDVVNDLEGQARRIVAHCGLEWDDACLDFHRTERVVRTASLAQVRQPIYASSIGRSRPLRTMLRPLIDVLGCMAELSDAAE